MRTFLAVGLFLLIPRYSFAEPALRPRSGSLGSVEASAVLTVQNRLVATALGQKVPYFIFSAFNKPDLFFDSKATKSKKASNYLYLHQVALRVEFG